MAAAGLPPPLPSMMTRYRHHSAGASPRSSCSVRSMGSRGTIWTKTGRRTACTRRSSRRRRCCRRTPPPWQRSLRSRWRWQPRSSKRTQNLMRQHADDGGREADAALEWHRRCVVGCGRQAGCHASSRRSKPSPQQDAPVRSVTLEPNSVDVPVRFHARRVTFSSERSSCTAGPVQKQSY